MIYVNVVIMPSLFKFNIIYDDKTKKNKNKNWKPTSQYSKEAGSVQNIDK